MMIRSNKLELMQGWNPSHFFFRICNGYSGNGGIPVISQFALEAVAPLVTHLEKLENMVISHSYVKLPESIWETKMGDGALNLECGY